VFCEDESGSSAQSIARPAMLLPNLRWCDLQPWVDELAHVAGRSSRSLLVPPRLQGDFAWSSTNGALECRSDVFDAMLRVMTALRLLALLVVSLTGLTACDPGYTFTIRNPCDSTMTVDYGDSDESDSPSHT
jgi:hypothetical protein